MRLVPLLVCCLIACGDDGVRHTPDATPHDGPGSPDSPAIDAAPNPVTIAALLDGQPVAGVHVYFQNADSTVVLSTITDAQGTASAVMAAGGYVTAVDAFTMPQAPDEIATFAGVKPGDHLVLSAKSAATQINVTVQVPDDAAATSYTVYTPCSTPTAVTPPLAVASGTVTLTNCGTSTDFLVVTSDQTGTPLNAFYAANQAVADNGTVDLTNQTYAGVLPRTYTMNNVPALRSTVIDDFVVDPHGIIWNGNTSTPSDTTNPSATLAVPTFTNANDIVVTYTSQGSSEHVLVDWGPYSQTFTTDVGARVLPFYTASPTFDTTTHMATITEDTTGQTPDLSVIAVNGFRQTDQRSWDWTIAAPHATSIGFPTLPTDVYDFNFAATDQTFVSRWTNAKVPGGYDAVRAQILNALQPTDFAVSGTGQAALEDALVGFTSRTAPRWRPTTRRVLTHRVR